LPKSPELPKLAIETKGKSLPLINTDDTDQEQALNLAVLERTP
jgi:hypothetical protein